MIAKRRWVLWSTLCALLLAFVAIAGAIVHHLRPAGTTVKPSAFQKIEIGMSERDVLAIVGGPPGNYATQRVRLYHCDEMGYRPRDLGIAKSWYFNSEYVTVWFKDGKVQLVEWGTATPEPSWLEEAYRGLRRQP